MYLGVIYKIQMIKIKILDDTDDLILNTLSKQPKINQVELAKKFT